jgi:hypothetical protein
VDSRLPHHHRHLVHKEVEEEYRRMHAPVVVGAGQGGVAPGAQPPPVQGDLDDVVQQPIGGGLAEAFPPPPQLPDLERVDDPDAPKVRARDDGM